MRARAARKSSARLRRAGVVPAKIERAVHTLPMGLVICRSTPFRRDPFDCDCHESFRRVEQRKHLLKRPQLVELVASVRPTGTTEISNRIQVLIPCSFYEKRWPLMRGFINLFFCVC